MIFLEFGFLLVFIHLNSSKIKKLYQDSFFHYKVRTNWNLKSSINIFKIFFFVSCLKLFKVYSPSVFLKDRLMLNVFESLKWKAKIEFEIPDWKCLKFGKGGGMAVTHFVAQFTHVSRHFGGYCRKQKKRCLGKTVLKMRSQICENFFVCLQN